MTTALAALLLPTIWIVDAANGPGTDFVDLRAAVLAAASGDTILVRAGSYGPVSLCGKALSIRGSGPAATVVAGITVLGVPLDEAVLLAGLRFEPAPGTKAPAVLVQGPGAVLVNDCQGLGPADRRGWPGLLVLGQATLHATRCAFLGGDSTYVGPFASEGGRGAEVLVGARLAATGCAFLGGSAGANPVGTTIGGQGLLVDGAAADLRECACFGGDAGFALFGGPGFGGDALYTSGSVRVGGGQAPVLLGGVAHDLGGPTATNPGLAVVRTAGIAAVDAGVVLLPAVPGAPVTSGVVALQQPDAPRLVVAATCLPSGETDLAQPVQVVYEGGAPYAPWFLIVGFRPEFSSAVVPGLLVQLRSGGVCFGVLDGAGRAGFAFHPASLLGLTGIAFLAQAGTFDPVAGPRLSNVDVRVYGP
ncbi:MAG: hypothetical protein KF830_15305 [Planctomycetes bacterium]|nr:hypothetical protein [Planctomycetota bacterium]